MEIGKYFQSLGASYLIAADCGDPRRVQEAGRVKPAGGLTDAQWESLGIIRTLRDHRYDGCLVVEQDATPVNPTAIARDNRLYLEALLKRETQSVEND